MAAIPIASVRLRDRALHVVRHQFCVGLHDGRQPTDHAGFTMHLDDARSLGEALIGGQSARVATREARMLTVAPEREIDAGHQVRIAQHTHPNGGWELTDAQARRLGDALVRAADHDRR